MPPHISLVKAFKWNPVLTRFIKITKRRDFDKKIPVIHWKTLTFFTFQIDPLWDGSQGVKAMDKEMFSFTFQSRCEVHTVNLWCVIVLNHGVHNRVCICRVHSIMVCTMCMVLFTYFSIMVCTLYPPLGTILLQTTLHPTKPHSGLKFKIGKLEAGIWPAGNTTSPPVQPPDRPPETTSDFTPRKIQPPKSPLLTSQMRRTANPGDPV